MAEFFVYADESGSDGESAWCAVAGYIAPPELWKEFRHEWRAVLDKDGIEEFHAFEFFSRLKWQSNTSPHHGWTDERAEHFIASLLDIIQRHRPRPIGSVTDAVEFRALPKEARQYFTGAMRSAKLSGSPSNVYFVGFHTLFETALLESTEDSLIHSYFDALTNGEPYARAMFNALRALPNYPKAKRLESLAFADSQVEEGIQAADLLAYVWKRHVIGSMDDQLQRCWTVLTGYGGTMGRISLPTFLAMLKTREIGQSGARFSSIGRR